MNIQALGLRLPRTIRLDPSDTFVFRHAATPGEWAVTGAFLFADGGPDVEDAKARAAFRSGFLGIDSFGWSTLVVVTEASEAEREGAVTLLATRLMEHLGAPDMERARVAAMEEIDFAASLCDHLPQTLLALTRGYEKDGLENGVLHERFRTLTPRRDRPKQGLLEGFRAFEIVEGDEDEDKIAETVDLLAMGGIAAGRGKVP